MSKVKLEPIKKAENWLPDGCDDKELYTWVKSPKCMCSLFKGEFASFCTACYLALPYELRLELWRPWKDGFAETYTKCIDYLENRTTRFTCLKGTSSLQTFTSSSEQVKKKGIGKRFRKAKELESVFAQETSPPSGSQTKSSGSTSLASVTDLNKSSTSQVTTNTTARVQKKLEEDLPF